MLLSELKPSEIYPGIKVLSLIGKVLTIVDFDSVPYSGVSKYIHPVTGKNYLVNNCVNTLDDGFLWMIDESNQYHGGYLFDLHLELI